ncbi:MAG: nucleotidyl transferase AbiEii/AbiGii toxin family protein [Candidatus Omnitrophota bacterium]
MDKNIREAQKEVLKVFSRHAQNFALSGGTALELYYLHHRFSIDLDFFSPVYDVKEIDLLIKELKKDLKTDIKLENELMSGNKAKVRFYTMPISDSEKTLKIDFVEDVIVDKPEIENFEGVRVYGAHNIYLQKASAITGTQINTDHIGREIMQGRVEARDAFDLYMLSKKISPLHVFLKSSPGYIQRGIIQWYRRFSRTDLKLSLLDLDIYSRTFDSKEMIIHLEEEIEKFMQETII